MEIHAPERPIHSAKDFGIHIAIVTIGILIALALDGARELVHEHRLVRETRENFREELELNRGHMTDELARVTAGQAKLQVLAAEAPALAPQHADQILARLEDIQNPYYFFSANAWQAALSTGSMALIDPKDVTSFAWDAEGTRIYVGLQADTMTAETRAIAFWRAHPHPTPDQMTDGEERILIFARSEQSMAFVAPQIQHGYDRALAAAAR